LEKLSPTVFSLRWGRCLFIFLGGVCFQVLLVLGGNGKLN
jgi:hypothetical protein